jgi:hypothetical protein
VRRCFNPACVCSALSAELQGLQNERSRLLNVINESPSIDEIEEEISRARKLIPTELIQAKRWKSRKDRLHELLSYLRPVNHEEVVGFFDPDMFKLATVPLEHQAESTIPPPTFQRPMSQELVRGNSSNSPKKSIFRSVSSSGSPQMVDAGAGAAYPLNPPTPRTARSGVSQSVSTPRSARSVFEDDDDFQAPRKKSVFDGMPKVVYADSEPTRRSPSRPELINGILPVSFTMSQATQKDAVKLTDISAARKTDKHLDKIFDVLKGRESSLLTTINKDGIAMQNIMAWTTYEVC